MFGGGSSFLVILPFITAWKWFLFGGRIFLMVVRLVDVVCGHIAKKSMMIHFVRP